MFKPRVFLKLALIGWSFATMSTSLCPHKASTKGPEATWAGRKSLCVSFQSFILLIRSIVGELDISHHDELSAKVLSVHEFKSQRDKCSIGSSFQTSSGFFSVIVNISRLVVQPWICHFTNVSPIKELRIVLWNMVRIEWVWNFHEKGRWVNSVLHISRFTYCSATWTVVRQARKSDRSPRATHSHYSTLPVL